MNETFTGEVLVISEEDKESAALFLFTMCLPSVEPFFFPSVSWDKLQPPSDPPMKD